jgi:hypothetical protein
MPIEIVKAKLHEARSYLNEMRDEEKAFGPRYYDRLSAFLSAARSVDYRLRCEYGDTYRSWRTTWNAQYQYEDHLLKCMHDKRDDEVHACGSGLSAKSEEIKIGAAGGYSDKSGTFQSTGAPKALSGHDATGRTSKQTYLLNVCGTERPATEACEEYLTVLQKMVAQFEADACE